MNEKSKKYNIPQEILYAVCLSSWELCRKNLETFAGFKAYYTEAFIYEAIASVRKARELPGILHNRATSKEARIDLQLAGRQVMDNWQLLKLYINKAFGKDLAAIKLEAAGASIYTKAALYNWSAVRSLADVAGTFIRNNKEALTEGNNMPEKFQTRFVADGDKFIGLSMAFGSITMENQMATQLKINANNAIYESAIEMLKDGQQIFRYDAIIKRQFNFNYLVSVHSGKGSASFSGYITDEVNHPVEGATIQSHNQKYTAIADSKGYYCISHIAEGTYVFNITRPGYEPVEQAFTFTAGTARKEDFIMKKHMQLVA
jgi:hypothetical protein